MKEKLIFGRKTLFIFLFFTSLFFYDFCKVNLAFADSSIVTNSMRDSYRNDAEGFSAPITTCKGISSLHTTKKVVALTFDDGPHKKYTEQILEILRLNNIKGTFFFIGKNAEEYPGIVRAAYRGGNVIGNHSYSHYHLNRLAGEEIEAQLAKTSETIRRIIGVYPLLFRPPYGACSAGSVRVAKNLHLKTIMWNAMVDDYHVDRTTSEKIAYTILKLVHPGAIIGLHDGGGNREKTVEALQIIINVLRSQGYEFLTIPELLDVQAYAVPD